MIAIRYAWVVAAVISVCSVSRADDTIKLGGTGSMRDAATVNLKGTGDADNVPVCCWWRRFAYYGAPVCCAPVYSAPVYYNTPSYQPAVPTGPPPAAGPAAYYYSPAPPSVSVAVSRPTITVGYQGRFFSGAVAIRPGARFAAPARQADEPAEYGPMPRSNDSFRYDGGPARTVPMPSPDPVSPADPVPTTVPALHKVMLERSRPKVNYPAYGEKPAKKPAVIDPLLVKRNAE
jgi:hypothetical protein